MADHDSTGVRTCTECKQAKPATLQFFHSHIGAQGGLNPRCKECRKAETRAYYLANTERLKQNARQWQKDNPEKANAKKAAWAKKNEDREKQRKRDYKDRNREILRKREAARIKQRELTDPAFRLRRLMSRRMWMSLRNAKDGWSWEKLVGYTRSDLHAHLERQFTKGMSWEAFAAGKIHIDHILPVASFNYTTPHDPEFQACWCLANLRPMWAKENCSKGAKITSLL